jgi:hypothetical protein
MLMEPRSAGALEVLSCGALKRSWISGEWLVMVPCVLMDLMGASAAGGPATAAEAPGGPASGSNGWLHDQDLTEGSQVQCGSLGDMLAVGAHTYLLLRLHPLFFQSMFTNTVHWVPDSAACRAFSGAVDACQAGRVALFPTAQPVPRFLGRLQSCGSAYQRRCSSRAHPGLLC